MTTFGDRYRITAVMMWSGVVTLENVYEVRVSTAGTDDDSDVLDACADWLDSAYDQVDEGISGNVSFTEIRGFNVTQNRPLPAVSWPSLNSGNDSTDIAPTGVSGLVKFYTDLARTMARKFIPGLTEGQFSGSLLVAGAISKLVSYGIIIMAGPGTLPGGTVLDFGLTDKLGAFRKPLRLVVSAIPAYQRRRRMGAGV